MKQEKERINNLQKNSATTMDIFNYGDKVRFTCNGGDEIVGTIVVKDYQGGGIYYGICPSVDIQGVDCILYKHVPIVDIELLQNKPEACNFTEKLDGHGG